MAETPDQSMSWGSFLSGMLVGAVAGAVVSLLYAPKPGKQTREELLQRLEELRGQLEEMAMNASESMKERLAETRADLERVIEASREAAAQRAEALRKQAGID